MIIKIDQLVERLTKKKREGNRKGNNAAYPANIKRKIRK